MNYYSQQLSRSIFFLLVYLLAISQAKSQITYTELSPMPEKVTNNAVTQAEVDGSTFLYSFSGMDSTIACGHAHLRSYKYSIDTDVWFALPDLPDPLGGVVAAGASTIKNKIYIIGGYHITDNCSEISSNAVHMFDPVTETYTKLANIPIAIDDHVQAVYNDSLLYVITGWSNSTNVTQVQIYDPSNDTWQMGTPVPNDPDWRVFGASGSIIGNQIMFLGGASFICNANSCFAPTNILRWGFIDEDDPTIINWMEAQSSAGIGYRMAASTLHGNHLWIGGSDITYNFDGIDYNGTGGVKPNNRITSRVPNEVVSNFTSLNAPPIMDLRGVGKIDETLFVTAGGMLPGQEVTNKVYLINILNTVNTQELIEEDFLIYPNPSIETINIPKKYAGLNFNITATDGKLLQKGKLATALDISTLPDGQHIISVFKDKKLISTQAFMKIK